jgi:hypothetical protein
VFVQLVFVGNGYEVVEDFFLAGVFAGPVWVGFELERSVGRCLVGVGGFG